MREEIVLELYHSINSVCAQKIRLALVEKGLSCTEHLMKLNGDQFDPAYLNYTMGKLMIRKLREDWTASRGGAKAWKDFHDQFLEFGGPPIPLVRNAMLGAAAGPPL